MVYIYAFVARLLFYPYIAYKCTRFLPDWLCRVLNVLFILEFALSTLSLLVHRFVVHPLMSDVMSVNLYIFFGLGYMTAFIMGVNIFHWLLERLSGQRLRDVFSLTVRQRIDYLVAIAALGITAFVVYTGWQSGHKVVVHAYSEGNETKSPLVRIALVTDLHIGEGVGLGHVRQVVDETLALKPDVIFFGGDYIDHSGVYARDPQIMAEMKRLKAPDGVYFIPGNHEYRADSLEKLAWVGEIGATLLVDSIVYPRGDVYSIIGRDDYVHKDSRKSLKSLLTNFKPKTYNILLEHTPEDLDSLQGTPIDYALYGHTHGGQIWPYMHLLKLKYDVPYGYAEYGRTRVIVSSGAGAAGTLFRLGTRSEIIALTLYPKQ